MGSEARGCVLDASAIVEVILGSGPDTPFDDFFVPGTELHVPAVCDVEVLWALGLKLRTRMIVEEQARVALLDYLALPITRHMHPELLGRMYELRSNISPADASYVALAEALGLPLVTADRSLARATRRHTRVRVVP